MNKNSFIIQFCSKDEYNDDVYLNKTEYGVFLDVDDVIEKVHELNQPIKEKWDIKIQQEKKAVGMRQKRWDALNEHGLAEGIRPTLNTFYMHDAQWRPGLWDGGYYFYESIDIHESKKNQKSS